MFCSACATRLADNAHFCNGCGSAVNGTGQAAAAIPPGVKGWSWGAFLLTWIWAIGNRTWIGLLALIPYVGIVVGFWLGFKGREMAWKNGNWEDLEHFNRVQRLWSCWAVGLVLGCTVLGVVAAFAIPLYFATQHSATF